MTRKNHSISVEFEVWRELQARRETEEMTENDVLRKIFNLPQRRNQSKHRKSRPKVFDKVRVSFSDGTVLCDNTVTTTFVDAINKIGPQRILTLGIKMGSVGLIEKQPHLRGAKDVPNRDWKILSNGHYVNVCSSTPRKYEILKQIKDELGENFRVELLKG